MRINDIKGISVLDKDAKTIGKIDDVEFDVATGQIEEIIVSLAKNIFSKDEVAIKYEDIETVGDYIILSINLPEKTEVEAEVEEE